MLLGICRVELVWAKLYSLVSRIASKGAKNLILLSRSGASSASAQQLVQELCNKGVRVEAFACDVTNVLRLSEVLSSVSQTLSSIVTLSLTHKLARTISIPALDIDVAKPLHSYGVDSLVAVELRNWLAKKF